MSLIIILESYKDGWRIAALILNIKYTRSYQHTSRTYQMDKMIYGHGNGCVCLFGAIVYDWMSIP